MTTGICPGCQSWRRHHAAEQGFCEACGRGPLALRGRWRRLCWKHAGFANADPHAALDPLVASRYGQQLFLTFTISRPRDRSTRSPRNPPAAWRLAPPVFRASVPEAAGPDQPVLPGMPDADAVPMMSAPDPLVLARVFEHVDRLAVERGWRDGSRRATRSGLRLVLAHYQAEALSAKKVEMLAEHYGFSRIGRARVIDVLHDAGLLVDGRAGRAESWLARHVGRLPEPFLGEFTKWFRVLAVGHRTPPRSLPRQADTVIAYAKVVLPAVAHWATTHASLREVEAADISAWLERLGPVGGDGRHLTAIRSLFSTLKKHRVIFADPSRALRIAPRRTLPLPADLNALRAVLEGCGPRTVAATALAAYHALSPAQLRALRADDLRGIWLRVGDRRVLLAEPVIDALRAWSAERHRRWPSTANPHLFVTEQTAVTVDKATTLGWLGDDLRRYGLTARGLREDRILEEIRSTGGDIRRVQTLFGLSDRAADRYLAVLDGAEKAVGAANRSAS